MQLIKVLRLGHRIERDKRITTHCALVARAFGANEIILSGEKDAAILESVKKVCLKWGGGFKISYEPAFSSFLRKQKRLGFKIVHLTMYGEEFFKRVPAIKKEKKIVLVIGSQKVPPIVYQLADYNVSVGSQPHSEVAALSILLYSLRGKKYLYRHFGGLTIVGSNGKKIFSPAKR